MMYRSAVVGLLWISIWSSSAVAQQTVSVETVMDDCVSVVEGLMRKTGKDADNQLTLCVNIVAQICQQAEDAPTCFGSLGQNLQARTTFIRDQLPTEPHPKWIKADRDRYARYLRKSAGGGRSTCADGKVEKLGGYCAAMDAAADWSATLKIAKVVERAWTRCYSACSKED